MAETGSPLERAQLALNAGRQREAIALLRGVRSVPRDPQAAALLASCHRRLGNPTRGLRVLSRHVRSLEPSQAHVEYAGCLLSAGAWAESLRRLERIDGRALPGAYFQRARVRMHAWDWAIARSELEAYLRTSRASGFRLALARAYLGACILHGSPGWSEASDARELLLETASRCERTYRGISRLCLRFAIQASVLSPKGADRAEARRLVERLELAGVDEPLAERAHFCRAWLALAALPRGRDAIDSIGHPEQRRELEFFAGMLLGDRELLRRVWYGSPFPALKRRIEETTEIPERLTWRLSGGAKGTFALELHDAATRGTRSLLAAICADLYRPAPLAELHERAFPGEAFNPHSSPAKVRQAIRRLRKHLNERGLPIVVAHENARYRLAARGRACAIVLTRARDETPPWVRERISRLRLEGRTREITAREAARALAVSRPTAYRCLELAADSGSIERVADGRAWRYRLPPV